MLSQIKAQVPPALNGMRFDIVAAQVFEGFSRKKIKMIIDRGGAYVNKKRILVAKKTVSSGDIIELFWDESRPLSSRSTKHLPVTLLDNREDFVVVNKPAGLPSQATLTTSDDTVIHALKQQYPDLFGSADLQLVHRLDKDTSGVMLVAKSKSAQARLEKLFQERKMSKTYYALCYGSPKSTQGVLDWAIRKDSSRPNTYVAVMSGAARRGRAGLGEKSARTRFLVVNTFQGARACLIECQPETGRTHQIRVHLQALGVPLLGDKTYSTNVVGHPLAQLAGRHMLHAARIGWTGADGEEFAFEAPFPDDFSDCLNHLKKEG
jgi:RluA family pseudouridine synthase